MHHMMRSELIFHNLITVNRLGHFIGCLIEALVPSHLLRRDSCPTIDGLTRFSISTCGHMRPPSKGYHLGTHQEPSEDSLKKTFAPGVGHHLTRRSDKEERYRPAAANEETPQLRDTIAQFA